MTYKQIENAVKKKFGKSIKPCWIAHVKELNGIPVHKTWNRRGKKRKHPCPDSYRVLIEDVMGLTKR